MKNPFKRDQNYITQQWQQQQQLGSLNTTGLIGGAASVSPSTYTLSPQYTTSTTSIATSELSPAEQLIIIMLVELLGPKKAHQLLDSITDNPLPNIDCKMAEKVLEKLHKNENDIDKVIEDCAKDLKI